MKQTYTIDEIGILLSAMPEGSFDLCLAFIENSFRVCVRGADSGELIYYRQYSFLQITRFSDALHEMKEIVATEVLFANGYKHIKIGITGRAELTPLEFYKPQGPGYLSSTWDELQVVGSLPIDEALQEFYAAFFPTATYHVLPLQWMKLVAAQATPAKLFVHIDAHLLYVFYALSPSEIRFFNTFDFRSPEDFAYYTNLIAQELHINREATELVLSGDVAFPSQLYNISYTYFQKVSFLESPAVVLSKLFAQYPKHQNIHLFSL
ncbi:MAG: DUF3822 family protein [Chitinophagales bacterium]|nr:DUF3822 family protein [Chitinophagales bacterium]